MIDPLKILAKQLLAIREQADAALAATQMLLEDDENDDAPELPPVDPPTFGSKGKSKGQTLNEE